MGERSKILLVEDDPSLRRITRRLLHEAGYEVEEAITGEEGLRLVTTTNPDLVLLDVVLPDVGGLQVCRQIKADISAGDPFVVLLSGIETSSEIQARGLESGADGYITRPLSNQEFLARVAVMLRLKRAERALQASEQRYRSLVSHSSDGIAIVDERGAIVEWNRAAQEITGLERAQVMGRPLWDVQFDLAVKERQTEDNYQRWKAMLAHFLRTGEAPWPDAPTEIEIRRPDGARRVVQSALFPIPTRQGSAAASIMRDVTERVQAEEELRNLNETLEAEVTRRTAQLRAEQERTEAILLRVDDAIFSTDAHLHIRYINPAFNELTGYSGQEILNQPMELLIAEGLQKQDRPFLRQALARRQSWHGEVVIRRKDGRTYDADLSVFPIWDHGGRFNGYVSSHRDITRFKDLERARSEFMANISHELRTPVTNIKLYAARLLRLGCPPEQCAPSLEVIEGQANRLADLIQDILEMIELDSGQASIDWRPVSVRALLRDAVDSHADQAAEAGVEVVRHPVPRGLPPITGDAARLTQALGKVLENAIAFSPHGGRVSVTAASTQAEGIRWVTVTVRDSGPGVQPDERDLIFERLYRGSLAQSGHVPGTGLGLSIVREILRAHGGRVTVQSDPEQGPGSAFTLWLRATPEDEADKEGSLGKG